MKAYVAVTILAMAAAVVAVLVMRQPQVTIPTDVSSIDSPTATHRRGSTVAPDQHPTSGSDPKSHARDTDQLVALPAERDGVEPDSEDWDAPCGCFAAWHARKQERERAAREAEPKDINWAYETEQLLEQFIVAHPLATTIQISGIECRTSFCEIKAIAPLGSWDAFAGVVEQALREPWSTFSGKSSSGWDSRRDGEQDFHAIIERTPMATTDPAGDFRSSVLHEDDEGCECATMEWRRRKTEQEAAARAAEPKDVHWAYATEQQLQQFFATHLKAVEFQVPSIDCRTTFCEIRVIGLTDQSPDVFKEVIRDAVAQEQVGLAQRASLTASRSDGGIQISARVNRGQ